MNRNVMIVLAGGFLIAVLVALLVQASLSGGQKEQPAFQEEPKVEIIVAAVDMKIGAELTDENMKWQSWPKSAVFPGAVVREEKKIPSEMLAGRLLREIKAGEPLAASALVPDTAGNFLAATLDVGMRAFAVDVNASSMVGGFVGPGDFVDVILTYKRKIRYEGPENPEIDVMIEKTIDNLATETVLENVRVLAVDQTAMRGGEEEKIKVGKTVTLEVDYKEAEVLALASKMGDLSLALRRLGDETTVAVKPPVTTDARVTSIYDEVYENLLKLEDNTGNNAKTVRIYRGDVVEDVSARH